MMKMVLEVFATNTL